ncbi:MAG: hypothetical protein R3F20_04480 [Planctomycetota bacterium]
MFHARFIVIAVVLSLVAPLAFGTDSWWDDAYEQKTVKLSDIVKTPKAYKGVDVTFVVQFNSVGSIDNPFYTKFEKDQFVNFSVWGDESQLWVKDQYKNDFPYMFIDRIKKDAQAILTAQTYDRFIVTGRVESIFRGKPWIEVTGLKPLETKLTEPALIRMVKAYQLKGHRRFDAAAAEFRLAQVATLPEGVKNLTLREEGMCLAAVERYEDALPPLAKALEMTPKDEELAKMVKHCQDTVTLAKKKREDAEKKSEEKKESQSN